MRTLNYAARGVDEATDVLAFPIDEQPHDSGPRELGDVFLCPEKATDVTEAAVHGTLHLCGFDHETDQGEMLELQAKVMASLSSRAGFVGLAGRPNVGKSTLVNAIVGSHVAIVSERPQTTRRAIRGVATDLAADWQLVMTDLPGVQRPRDALTERMQRRVEREIADSDAVLFVVNAEQGVGPGDRFISKALLQSSIDTPVVCAVNKVDRLNNAETAAVLAEVAEVGGVDEIFPVSARKGNGLEPLIARLIELLPESPFLFPPEQRSDLPSEVLLAELIREQVLRRTRDELPHAVEVQVSEVAYREDGVVEVLAHVWAETESQKGILIGAGGRKIKEIGTAARAELERELGGRVFLDLQVRVRKRWRKDEGLLDRLGIE